MERTLKAEGEHRTNPFTTHVRLFKTYLSPAFVIEQNNARRWVVVADSLVSIADGAFQGGSCKWTIEKSVRIDLYSRW